MMSQASHKFDRDAFPYLAVGPRYTRLQAGRKRFRTDQTLIWSINRFLMNGLYRLDTLTHLVI